MIPWLLWPFVALHLYLLDGFLTGLNRITFPETNLTFVVDDGVETHVGVEKIFLAGTKPVGVRFGAWSDPDHRIRAERTGNAFAAVFPEGQRVNHFTGGFGVTFEKGVQIDFAADVSSVDTTAVFSTIYRF